MGEARQWAADFGAAVRHAVDDNCFILAKAVSYSAVLALFPGLVAAANLLLPLDDISLAMDAVLPSRVRVLLADYLTAADEHSTAVLLIAGAASVLFAADPVGAGNRTLHVVCRDDPALRRVLRQYLGSHRPTDLDVLVERDRPTRMRIQRNSGAPAGA